MPYQRSDQNVLLADLDAAISSLPLTILPATADDLISLFLVDPVDFVVSPTVPWEELIKKALDDFLNDGSRSKNTLELSQLIRRGNLGINGFSIRLRRCFSELEISPRVVEGRVRQIIRAMMFLCVIFYLSYILEY
jgi:hypothetical protein